tara:strand:- start:12557 stop:13483 length:927 start_codon:yes stop_codon:yes gene_type:complete
MKKIFICEYVTGGGYINNKVPKKLFLQARTIVKSLLIDFNEIDNLKIIYTWDYRLKKRIKKNKNTECIIIKKEPTFLWKNIIKKVDFYLPIAPETNLKLVNLIKLGSKKEKTLSNSINAVKKTSSKFKTYNFFKKNSIPTIKTFNNLKKIKFKDNNKWVFKPDDGAGSEKNLIINNKNLKKLHNLTNLKEKYIVQPFIKGENYSVNILPHCKKFILNFNKQKISYKKNKIIFNGTKYTKKIPFEKEITKKINIIINKLPGLKSFFGIDLIITKKNFYFIEINPRITTSYKNIKKKLDINIAKKIIRKL